VGREVTDWAAFRGLSTPEVAELVRGRVGPVVFAAGGTTRWFMLNHLGAWPEDLSYWPGYLREGGRRLLEILQLFFDHGLTTIFTHAIVPGQLEGKPEGYAPLALSTGMERIAGDPQFRRFYREQGVRVRFYGDYRAVLEGSEHEATLRQFDAIEAATGDNERRLLYWGFNTRRDQITPFLELAAAWYRERGRTPTRDEVVEAYYGEPLKPVDIFIGFNRSRTAVLMPPLLGDRADLYFTVGLSFDFGEAQLRSILYDHLFARRGWHRDYGDLPEGTFERLQDFYALNRDHVLGLGRRDEDAAVWHPLPQVVLPQGWGE
jgi:hypothetical protein